MRTIALSEKIDGVAFPARQALSLCLAALVTLVASMTVAAGEQYQQDWVPNNYKVDCAPPDHCMLSDSEHAELERLLRDAVAKIRSMKFRAPQLWGKRVGAGTADDYIELYEISTSEIASASPRCPRLGINMAHMSIGQGYREWSDREYLVYYFIAHETFHLSSYGYPFYDAKACKPAPGWIFEGTATAVGQAVMIERYPSVTPSQDEREARNFAGKRRYDIPLPDRQIVGGQEAFTGPAAENSYRTSSFWRHLAETYHAGRYDYLNSYMVDKPFHEDWVAWLRKNVELDTDAHLGIVFSGFLADYAGWGDDTYPGEFFGRTRWLKDTLGSCAKVYLDKSDVSEYVDVEIRPLAGRCIEVRVSALGENGLETGESAAVQIAGLVMVGPAGSRDGLHLSLAASNDKDRFLCAQQVKANGRGGLGRCLFMPDDGKIHINGGTVDARVWNVIAQDKGEPAEARQEQGEGKGELVNIYTVSYTPLSVSSEDTRYGGIDPIRVRLYFVLDVAKLEIDGQRPASSGPTKMRVKAALTAAPHSDPQTTLPKQDASGRAANSYSLPEQLRPDLANPVASADPAVRGKLPLILVLQQLWNGGTGGAGTASLVLTPAEKRGDEYAPYALSVGETGSFPLQIHGSLGGEPVGSIGVGVLGVEEFSDLVLRAHYQADVCRVKDLRPKNRCEHPVAVSGRVVKAFAGTRLPGNYMQIERTPGTELYRKATETALSAFSTSPGTPQPAGPQPSLPGVQTGAGGIANACTCTCEEREVVNKRGAALKAGTAAGENVDIAEVMALSRCSTVCQREYMICEMERNKKNTASEASRRAAETPAQCDCGCAALAELERRGTTLEARFKPGDKQLTEELMYLSRCFTACQAEYVNCHIQ